MSSLISPGHGTPVQKAFPSPWLGLQDWPNGFPGMFGPGFPNQMNEESFQQNNEVSDQHELSHGNDLNNGSAPLGPAGGANFTLEPSSSMQRVASTPLSPSTSRNTNAEATAENAKRLKELRALLMAKKPRETADSNLNGTLQPPRDSNQRTSPHQTIHAEMSAAHQKLNEEKQSTVSKTVNMPSAQLPNKLAHQALDTVEKSNIAGLDSLLDEVRNEIDGKEAVTNAAEAAKPNGTHATGFGNKPKPTKSVQIPHRPSSAQQRSSSEEGEIRSDEDVAPVIKKQVPVTNVTLSKEASIDSEEKSRRESEVEAAYKQPALPSKETQEKKRRQSQVDFAYSPLRKSSGASTKAGKPPLDVSTAHRKPSNNSQAPKSALEPSARPWVNQPKARAAEYDSYVPVYRKSSLNGQPTETGGKNQSKPTVVGEAARAGDRDKAMKHNEKVTAEYKRAIESRPQAPRVISHTETTYIGRINDDINEDPTSVDKGINATLQGIDDIDLRDWLELTEWFDEGHRTGRLARFRKKKELDRLRQQLDEEDQLEMQQRSQRSTFRPTGLGNEPTPKAVNIAPLPLTMSSTALPADSQVSTPTLKRQHAEDDTDSRNKFARPNPPLRGGGPSVKAEVTVPVPLEQRITRDDGHLVGSRYRPRSRSPERTRRRSASPELRRNSVPDHSYRRTCHNCGEPGHYQTTCPLPRRDGKDRYRAPQPKARADGVSLNYQGKSAPTGYQGPRAPGYGMNNRSNDDDDKRP